MRRRAAALARRPARRSGSAGSSWGSGRVVHDRPAAGGGPAGLLPPPGPRARPRAARSRWLPAPPVEQRAEPLSARPRWSGRCVLAAVLVAVTRDARFALFSALSPVLTLGTWWRGGGAAGRPAARERAPVRRGPGRARGSPGAVRGARSGPGCGRSARTRPRCCAGPRLPSTRLWERRAAAGDLLALACGRRHGVRPPVDPPGRPPAAARSWRPPGWSPRRCPSTCRRRRARAWSATARPRCAAARGRCCARPWSAPARPTSPWRSRDRGRGRPTGPGPAGCRTPAGRGWRPGGPAPTRCSRSARGPRTGSCCCWTTPGSPPARTPPRASCCSGAGAALVAGRGPPTRCRPAATWCWSARPTARAELLPAGRRDPAARRPRRRAVARRGAAAAPATCPGWPTPSCGGPAPGLPGPVRLLPLLGVAGPDGAGRPGGGAGPLAGRRRRPGLRTPLGVTRTGRSCWTWCATAPHGLVGGTTGAGKSELLRSLVAGLAVHAGPEHLTFVLVDYKGGAAFDACAPAAARRRDGDRPRRAARRAGTARARRRAAPAGAGAARRRRRRPARLPGTRPARAAPAPGRRRRRVRDARRGAARLPGRPGRDRPARPHARRPPAARHPAPLRRRRATTSGPTPTCGSPCGSRTRPTRPT